MPDLEVKFAKKPKWLKSSFKDRSKLHKIKKILRTKKLNTVCEEALCPNITECFSKRRATFMILGGTCTRNCRFCAVTHGRPEKPDEEEPYKIAEIAMELNLKHIVITSVTRDDLTDGGSNQFVKVIEAIRKYSNADFRPTIEVLTPDFQLKNEAINKVVSQEPDIFNHNLETVRRLTPDIRPDADYDRSLQLLKMVRQLSDKILIKSGIMIGLGETKEEVYELLGDLKNAGSQIVTIGQYLSPGKNNVRVSEYVAPEIFKSFKEYGENIGIEYVFSAPLVRSSYLAEEIHMRLKRHS